MWEYGNPWVSWGVPSPQSQVTCEIVAFGLPGIAIPETSAVRLVISGLLRIITGGTRATGILTVVVSITVVAGLAGRVVLTGVVAVVKEDVLRIPGDVGAADVFIVRFSAAIPGEIQKRSPTTRIQTKKPGDIRTWPFIKSNPHRPIQYLTPCLLLMVEISSGYGNKTGLPRDIMKTPRGPDLVSPPGTVK